MHVRQVTGEEPLGATVKSTVARAGHEYMRKTWGEAVWGRMLDSLSSGDRSLVDGIERAGHFPVALDGKLFEALVQVQFGGDRRLVETELRKGGAYQADAMLDGLFSVFARFVSPRQAFVRGGSIITSVYSSGVSSSTESGSDNNGGAIHIVGLGESSFISPWHCGWVERALERCGGKNARVNERSWESGLNASHELIYDVRWE